MTLALTLEHFQVLNCLSGQRGYRISYDPKFAALPTRSAQADHRYIIVYSLVKDFAHM